MNNNCVSLRSRTGDQIADIPVDTFIENLKQEIEQKIAEPSLVPIHKEN